MKHLFKTKYFQWGLTVFLVVAASILFYFSIFHMDILLRGLKKAYTILSPIIYAAAISYLLWPLVRFLEKKVIYPICDLLSLKPSKKIRNVIRLICVFLVIIVFIMAIYGLLSIMIPELTNSIMNIVNSFDRYVINIEAWASNFFKYYPEFEDTFSTMFSDVLAKVVSWLSTDFLPQLNNIASSVFSIVTFLKDFLVGIMVSIYLMFGKEKYLANGKKLLYCLFEPKTANNMIRDLQYINNTFGGFVIGKLLDSLIIGILCYIGTTLLNFPYALLISVFVGITNVIPFFGPFIGAIPSAILILMVNPMQCLYFILFILALQQFDGNFLGPFILGDSTGLSSFMVIVAILVGGGLFGVFGMFIGVPVCAVICTIFANAMRRRLEKKNLPTDVEFYKNMDHLDAETLEPIAKNQKATADVAFSSYRKKKNILPLKIENILSKEHLDVKNLMHKKDETNEDPKKEESKPNEESK